MKILVIGSGGREHALCWKLIASPEVEQVYCAPGNPGTAACGANVPIAATDLDRLAEFARREAIDLTVCGPEQPLCDGIQDRFAAEQLLLCGPSALAARLEGSKIFAKAFMARHGIPTAPFGVFEAYDDACRYIDENPAARVVKADGLAAGKGVWVAANDAAAKDAVRQLFEGKLGDAGRRVVVEQRLVGEEVSVIAVTDGVRVITLASSQDHKAAYDGDKGPNTGGMGAYSPAPVLDEGLARRVHDEVLMRTVEGMAADGCTYRGVLYAGLMIVDGALQVLEFNCRFGDPETQPLMARLADDLMPYLRGAAAGALPSAPPSWDPGAALCVVMAAAGYPGAYAKGKRIRGIAEAEAIEGVTVFHAGTALQDEHLVTAGGRVLGVTALGADIREARERAYRASDLVQWDGAHFRRDIGHRALSRE